MNNSVSTSAVAVRNPAPVKRLKLKKMSLSTRKANQGWIFVLPFVLGLLLVYLPILMDSIWFSVSTVTEKVATDGTRFAQVEFVGMQFYKQVFQQDFMMNLLEGLKQLAINVPAILIFSLFIAVILNQKMLGRAVFRAIFFIPVILSTGLMESIEAKDTISTSIGIDTGSENGGEEILSMIDVERLFSSMSVGSQLVEVVVGLVNRVYDIINYSGVQMLIFLAGLQSISPSIYEACQIEGATSWETFWKITFPMISPMILVNGIYTIIDSFTRADNVVMTAINYSYNGLDRELATAQSWIYFLMVLLVIAAFAGICSVFVFYQRRD